MNCFVCGYWIRSYTLPRQVHYLSNYNFIARNGKLISVWVSTWEWNTNSIFSCTSSWSVHLMKRSSLLFEKWVPPKKKVDSSLNGKQIVRRKKVEVSAAYIHLFCIHYDMRWWMCWEDRWWKVFEVYQFCFSALELLEMRNLQVR